MIQSFDCCVKSFAKAKAASEYVFVLSKDTSFFVLPYQVVAVLENTTESRHARGLQVLRVDALLVPLDPRLRVKRCGRKDSKVVSLEAQLLSSTAPATHLVSVRSSRSL